MNAQTVLLVVSFLAAATLALSANVPDGPPSPPVGVPVLDTPNRNTREAPGKADLTVPASGDSSSDDLKADSFFLYGGYGGWGGWGGWGYPRYGGWGGWGGWGGYRRPYGWGGWGWGW